MDHYTTLGVSKNASQDEIKKAYRKLAMQHHPDKGGSHDKFTQIQQAYDVLGDEQKRHIYDTPVNNPTQNSTDNSFDLSSIFRQAFGNWNQARQNNHGNVKHVFRTRVNVSFEDSYRSNNIQLQVGTPNGIQNISIQVPKGVSTGDNYRYDNVIQGSSLVIEFVVSPHLKFDRDRDDLKYHHSISVLDMIVGVKFKFTTISGTVLDIAVPPMTQFNQQLRIEGHGMPKQDGTYGDQIILFKPYLPANINNEIVEVIQKHQAN